MLRREGTPLCRGNPVEKLLDKPVETQAQWEVETSVVSEEEGE
jgi:hypothetical protein